MPGRACVSGPAFGVAGRLPGFEPRTRATHRFEGAVMTELLAVGWGVVGFLAGAPVGAAVAVVRRRARRRTAVGKSFAPVFPEVDTVGIPAVAAGPPVVPGPAWVDASTEVFPRPADAVTEILPRVRTDAPGWVRM